MYQREEYRRSQEYTRTNTRFDFVTSTFGLFVLLSFWFAGGFNYLDQLVRSWGFVPIINGLLYIGILLIGYSLLTLPLIIYATLDRVKGLGLAVVLGAPLLAAVLALFEYAGYYAWLYCWIAITMFSLILQYVAPTWIMPLFNKFTPLE